MSGRIARWAVQLGQFDIRYLLKKAIKGQVFADFVTEFVGIRPESVLRCSTQTEPQVNTWTLFIDGSSNMLGSGVGIVLLSPQKQVIEKAVRLWFKASNNEAE